MNFFLSDLILFTRKLKSIHLVEEYADNALGQTNATISKLNRTLLPGQIILLQSTRVDLELVSTGVELASKSIYFYK